MKKKLLSLFLILSILPISTGCSVGHFIEGVFKGPEEEKEEINDGYIYGETSILGVDSTQKDYMELLTDNTYYVIHDNIWYPLSLYYSSFDETQDVPEKADNTRIVCANEEYDSYIPTLYSSDKLVYYSSSNILDYTTFERFKDLGWTFPILKYNQISDGRLYLYYEKDADIKEYITLPDTDLYTIYNKDFDIYLYIDKIGGVFVDGDMLNESGLFNSKYLLRGDTLDFECYRGTFYEHHAVDVNTHAFCSYEIYAQPDFYALQAYTYEIPIPDYLLSGYYMINNSGLIRYVKDPVEQTEDGTPVARYSENYDFNEQLLFPIQDNKTEGYETPYMYSTLEELNLYGKNKQAEAGTIGYIDESSVADADAEDVRQQIMQSSFAKTYYFSFPKDKECTITVTSTTGEQTGDIQLTLDSGRVKELPYDIFNKNYSITLTGNDEIGELYVSGLFDDYKIELVNAVQTEAPTASTDIESQSTE